MTEKQTSRPDAATAEDGLHQQSRLHEKLRNALDGLDPQQAAELREQLRDAPLTRLVGLAGQAVGHTIKRMFAEDDGLSPGAARVLAHLAWGRGRALADDGEPGRATHTQLAQRSMITPATLTGVVTTLEKAGYVRRERDEEDRRVVWLVPTDSGLVRARQIADRMHDAHSALIPALSPELETAIRGFLITVIENDLAIVQELPPVSETEVRRPQC